MLRSLVIFLLVLSPFWISQAHGEPVAPAAAASPIAPLNMSAEPSSDEHRTDEAPEDHAYVEKDGSLPLRQHDLLAFEHAFHGKAFPVPLLRPPHV